MLMYCKYCMSNIYYWSLKMDQNVTCNVWIYF